MAVDLEQLLATKRRYTKHASDAARKEAAYRRVTARDLAKAALVNLYRKDYQDLYQQALAKVDAERGPFPG